MDERVDALDRGADPVLAPYASTIGPCWAFTLNGDQLLWANQAARRLMGLASPSMLSAIALSPNNPARGEIERFARLLPRSGPPRLQRIRGLWTKFHAARLCSCSRVTLADGVSSVLIRVAEPVQKLKDKAPEKSAATAPIPTTADPPQLATPQDKGSPLRFVWRIDANQILSIASEEFLTIAGETTRKALARTWRGAFACLSLDNSKALTRALEDRSTFNAVAIDWPLADAPNTIKILLSGEPVFNLDRKFEGFRGFGLCRDVDRLNALRMRLPAPVTPQTPTPDRASRYAAHQSEARPRLFLVPTSHNVVALRTSLGVVPLRRAVLSPIERNAFREIARVLGARTASTDSNSDTPPEPQYAPEEGSEARPISASKALPSAPPHTETDASTASNAHARELQNLVATAQREIAELRSVLDTATDGVVIIGIDGAIVSVNQSAEALFGFSARELVGRSFLDLFAPESHATALDYLQALSQDGVASLLNDGREMLGCAREGGAIPLFMTLGRLGEEGDKLCAVLRDITQIKRVEVELQIAQTSSQKAASFRANFLKRLSEDVHAPLDHIIDCASLILDERFGPIGAERYRDALNRIRESGQVMLDLIADLAELSRVESGKLELVYTSVNLNEVVSQSVALMQPHATDGRIIIRTSLSTSLPPVVADLRSVQQIMARLLSRSLKHSAVGNQIIVSTALSERGEAIIRVRDSGTSLTDEQIMSALGPFWREGEMPSALTDLSLPLAKALAEANRARFTVQNIQQAGALAEIIFPSTRVLAE